MTPSRSPVPARPGPRPPTVGRNRRRIPTGEGLLPWLARHMPLAVVMVMLAVAMWLVAVDRWRRGAVVFGLACIAGAMFRMALPTERVGLLAVRGRWFDSGWLLGAGTFILWLAVSIDPLDTD